MLRAIRRTALTFLLLMLCCVAGAQNNVKTVTIVGTVIDAETGEPLPFSNVFIRGTLQGVVTDFDGTYSFEVPVTTDSISFNVMGYHDQSWPLADLRRREAVIEMLPQTYDIAEVTVSPDDAPRRLIRQVIANKKRNDPTQYDRTSYEKYVRWEYSLNNISDKAQENFILRGTKDLMRMDADSNRYLPVYFCETISFNETQKKPRKLKSTIKADNVKGIDIFKQYEIGGFSSALEIELSFYENVVKFLEIPFVSPIADNALSYYKFYITDSTYVGTDSTKVYNVKFRPKSEGDKAFIGTMDIETKHYSIMRIDAAMPKYTNINFVKKFTVQSTYQMINDSLPFFGTNDIEFHVDYMPVNSDKQRLEVKCNMFNSHKDVTLNQPEPLELSAKALAYETVKEEGYNRLDSSYWNANRHFALSARDIEANNSIDSLNNVGSIKAFNKLVKLGMTGFYDIGRIELGPIDQVFNTNKVEGLHLGMGVRTSSEISENWIFTGIGGYGFKNSRPTIQVGVGYKFNSPYRRAVEVVYYDRIIKIGENENILYLYENATTTSETNIIAAIFSLEEIDELQYERKLKVQFDNEWITGISSRLTGIFRWQFAPPYYPFSIGGASLHSISQQEIALDTRFSFKEQYIDDGMQRLYMSSDYPIFHITFAVGNSQAGSASELYTRLHTTLKHKVFIGQTEFKYAVEAGMIFGTEPYSFLEMPRGNKTLGFFTYDFNMMSYLEFANDKYVYVYADYFLNGRLFNKIPRMSRIGLREVIGFKAMLGSLSSKHASMLDFPDKLNTDSGAYLEVNAGVANILRFFRVDVVWRITDVGNSDASRLGLRAQMNFNF